DQHMRLAVGLGRSVDRTDEERSMRPGRLREIFDDSGNAIVALDEQHVARLDDIAQMTGVGGCEGLVTRHFLLEIESDPLANGIEHYAHDTCPHRPYWPGFFRSLSCSKA